MIRLLLLKFFLLVNLLAHAQATVYVKNIEELNEANKKANPGDTIILQNGKWENAIVKLSCHGTKEKPIVFKAETAGKVLFTGNSKLKIGGSFIIADGFYFTNGYAGNDAVISFRINKEQLAGNCRVTNSAIVDFNNPKRMNENTWVLIYGKNNRIDHCSFQDKKNMGVLMAVILDDERSRENFHSIDHNYFGRRLPLASNTGEIIRVGVSQHCQFNSNTQITDNYFEYCDGETEIVSIKSGNNIVRGNVFKESQGGVVLRHGDYNTVENNIFLGNDKAGTGGVRLVGKGQWVVNNFFYKCRGYDFRSPLSIMNGIPNSPAHRYVQVTDAVIANNSYIDCAPASFCEGSDTERDLPPGNVLLANNIFYNNRDSIIYNVYDNISGFSFTGNEVSTAVRQPVEAGFTQTVFHTQKNNDLLFPVNATTALLPDSLALLAKARLLGKLSEKTGFADLALLQKIQTDVVNNTGAAWFRPLNKDEAPRLVTASCATTEEVYEQLKRTGPVVIKLTGKEYSLTEPFFINKTVTFTGNKKNTIRFNTGNQLSVFIISGNGHLTLNDISIDGGKVKATHFIASDSTGHSNHYNLIICDATLQNFNRHTGCENLFYAFKSTVADSIVISNSSFLNNNSNAIMMTEEKDNKGYYNAEKILVCNNSFASQKGNLLHVYRGGNDESTMGPFLLFSNNKIKDCEASSPLLLLTGVQVTKILSNSFTNANASSALITYKDIVRARHFFEENLLTQSGKVEKIQLAANKENKTY